MAPVILPPDRSNMDQRFLCRECGKPCEPREFHDIVECIRYRWLHQGQPTAPNLAFNQDLQSLLSVIDRISPGPRGDTTPTWAVDELEGLRAEVRRLPLWCSAGSLVVEAGPVPAKVRSYLPPKQFPRLVALLRKEGSGG